MADSNNHLFSLFNTWLSTGAGNHKLNFRLGLCKKPQSSKVLTVFFTLFCL